EMALAKKQAASAWENPEILAIPEANICRFLEHPRLGEYRVYIRRALRLRPHTLSEEGERIVALYKENADVLSKVYSTLIEDMDVDLGSIDTPDGQIELKKDAKWGKLYESPDREIRRKVHEKSSAHWESLKATMASLLSGCIKRNVIDARVRGYPSARAATLFQDNIGEEVYDNLIAVVNENMGALHRYYGVRKRTLGLSELRTYDMYMPLSRTVKRKTTWNEAACLLADAVKPMGDEYVSTLRSGLLGRWADRYMNLGKNTCPCCIGGYVGDPYLSMTYEGDSLADLLCLAHESGHSMHVWHGARANPFRHYRESIFEAETASAFHEELLFRHLLKTVGNDKEMRLYLVNGRINDFANMLYRHTMFAEFDHAVHRFEEGGTPLTLDVLSGEYRGLLAKYRGPEYVMDESSGLGDLSYFFTCLPFHMYVYATGVCAAIALADRVLGGGESEREDYIAFLKSGGSRFPMDSLKLAGVDMSRPEPVQAACRVFAGLVDELERLL
ncbi:MAG: oligoendopeptidase F family protein, partial [Treponema sp.]|nr:oligoendopeptidase F family protein [Treponema sp.]